MNAPLYTIEILRLAGSLPEPAALDRVDGSAELRSPTCGSIVSTEVQVKDGRLEAVSQKVQACAFGQASAALVAQGASGRNREEIAQALRQMTDWLGGEGAGPDWPGIGALSPALARRSRHGAILLPFRALLDALEGAA